ncbi:MAG: hypothetical protein ACRDYD_11415, partial [Acidimicrobiales bacterium]
MATLASLRRYLEAGQVIGQLARARAEDLWSDLLGGEDPRGYGEEWLGDVLERSRRSGAQVINALSGEVRRQVDGVRLG